MKSVVAQCRPVFVLGAALGFLSFQAQARDISAVSGIYENESVKSDGNKAGGESTLSGAVRFHDKLSPQSNVAWLASVGLQLSSYEAPENGTSPDNFTGLGVGGGLRYYFSPFNEYVIPFIGGGLTYRSTQAVSFSTTGYDQVRTSGLFYGMNAGVRVGLDQKFFLELELPFFDTGLWVVKTEQTESKTATTTVKTKRETTRRALFADSRGRLTDLIVGIGYKF